MLRVDGGGGAGGETILGITVPEGSPEALESAASAASSAAGVLDRTSAELAKGTPADWLGTAALSYADMCTTQQDAAREGGYCLAVASQVLKGLAHDLRAAQKACERAISDALDAKGRADAARAAAQRASDRANAERLSAAAAAKRASMSEALGTPAPQERTAQQQAMTAAADADRTSATHARAAGDADADLADAQRRGAKAAKAYKDSARAAAARLHAVADAAPVVSSVNGVPVAAVGGPGRPPAVLPVVVRAAPPPEKKHHGLFSSIVHGGLDAAGFVPVVGSVADGANAIYYAAEGDAANAALSAAAAVPIVGDAAAATKIVVKGTKAVEKGVEAEKVVKDGAEATKVVEEGAKGIATYTRPSGYRSGVRDEVWGGAVEPATGRVRDPVTGQFMSREKPWDMGHKPGYEFRKHQQSAEARGIDRGTFLDEHNDPSHYRPELPSSNQSHKGESLDDDYFGP
jgi:hypothetical protein